MDKCHSFIIFTAKPIFKSLKNNNLNTNNNSKKIKNNIQIFGLMIRTYGTLGSTFVKIFSADNYEGKRSHLEPKHLSKSVSWSK